MAEPDPYTALGVPRDADADAIRTAYRSRARGVHPDVNHGDPHAAEKFKELVAAYELLSDPLRRNAYDRDRDRNGGGGRWDFRSAKTSYSRRRGRMWSGPPQAWDTVRVVPLKERGGLGRRRRASPTRVDRVIMSPDLRRVATHGGDDVRLWDAASGRSLAHVGDGVERITWLGFSPEGRWLVTDGFRGTILWDTTSGRQVARLNLDGPDSLSFSADGGCLATAVQTLAEARDAITDRELARFAHEASVSAISLSADGGRLATAAHTTARVWDVRSGVELAQMPHDEPVANTQLSPDGRLLATDTTIPRSGWTPTAVRLWDVDGGEEVARLQHACWVERVIFSPDGQRLATESNGALHLWEVVSGLQPAWINPLFLNAELAFSPDGRWLATASRSSVYVWDAGTGDQLACLHHAGEVLSLAIGSDGRQIATAISDRSGGAPAPLAAQLWQMTERLAAPRR